MKIHFYKAREGKIGDKVVGLVSVFSHVELEIDGVFYSSSNRDGGVGINGCLSYFEGVKGQKYDWLNIFFSQIFKLNIQSNNKQICSEFVGNCLGLEDSYKYSPESLFYKLKELNYI